MLVSTSGGLRSWHCAHAAGPTSVVNRKRIHGMSVAKVEKLTMLHATGPSTVLLAERRLRVDIARQSRDDL
jgi:hypothetical protein